MDKKKIIVVSLIVLILLSFFIVFDYLRKKNGKTISPNILSVTQPVTSISGTVTSIDGDQITISLAPDSKTGVSYQVTVSDKTEIKQPETYVNYLFKTGSDVILSIPTLKDIKVGQHISVNSKNDLRTLANNRFEAVVINLPQKVNILNGVIAQINGNILTLKTTNQKKEYIVSVGEETEISHMSYTVASDSGELTSQPQPERVPFSELKEGENITIYTDVSITSNTKVKALRIDPR